MIDLDVIEDQSAGIICHCVDVEIGSYDNQQIVRIPEHMTKYRDARIKAGLSGTVCIDRCLVPLVKSLWGIGVKTSGCCCGHGKLPAYIGVLDRLDADIMETLGYAHDHSSSYPATNFVVSVL